MTITIGPVILFFILLAAFSLYGIGWLEGRGKEIRRRQRLEEIVDDMAHRIEIYNAQMAEDPQRAALDMGQRYVLNQISQLVEHLFDAIHDREHRTEDTL